MPRHGIHIAHPLECPLWVKSGLSSRTVVCLLYPGKRTCEPAERPHIAEARAATLKAMNEAEAGWRKAIDKIANLTKCPVMRRS